MMRTLRHPYTISKAFAIFHTHPLFLSLLLFDILHCYCSGAGGRGACVCVFLLNYYQHSIVVEIG